MEERERQTRSEEGRGEEEEEERGERRERWSRMEGRLPLRIACLLQLLPVYSPAARPCSDRAWMAVRHMADENGMLKGRAERVTGERSGQISSARFTPAPPERA